MSHAFFLTVISLVQSGWRVEQTPLVTSPFQLESAAPIDDALVGVVASGERDGGADFAVFIAHGGEEPRLVAQFDTPTRQLDGSGTGFTFLVKRGPEEEIFRIRPPGTLVSLGLVDSAVHAVSCDEAVRQCVLLIEGQPPLSWTTAGRTPFFEPWGDEELDLSPVGAAMRPSGGVVALALGQASAILDLTTGRLTLIAGPLTYRFESYAALVRELARKPALREALLRERDRCMTEPRGWNEGRAIISNAAMGDIGGPPCPAPDFELELRNGKRQRLPDYPWKVLDCPDGGWTSKYGTFVTTCVEEIAARLRKRGTEAPDTLPEAVGLSETQIFVMAKPKKTKWRWYRGPPKGKALEFVLEGPSVLTFLPRGVTVEGLSWPFGSAIFQVSLRDDWHLIQPEHATLALIRLTPDP
jgi:hypothetical protein